MQPIAGFLNTLTPVQLQAASWGDGSLMLLAGPGSGKTRVLTARIANLLKDGVKERWRILALTFTTRAADEMKTRLEALIPDQTDRLFVGTYHSFAAEILRHSGTHVGVRTNFRIYSAWSDRIQLLSEALSEAKLDFPEPIERALPVIDGIRDRLATPETCGRLFADAARGERFAAAFSAYDRFLTQENALDFPAIICKAHELLQRYPAIAEVYRRTYRYISIDEFQDTNSAQYSFIKAFSGTTYKNIFVVADDDQIIYQWNGASPKRLQQFSFDFDPAIIQMPTNFRCPSKVVALANNLVAHNLQRTPGKNPLSSLNPFSTDDACVRIIDFATDEDEANGIASDLAERHSAQLNSVVVLARTKKLLSTVATKLQERGIPARLIQRRDSFASIPFQWLHSSLKMANRRSDRKEFLAFVEAGNALLRSTVLTSEAEEVAGASHGDLLRSWIALIQAPDAFAEAVVDAVKTYLAERNDYSKFVLEITRIFGEDSWDLGASYASMDEDERAWRDLFQDIRRTIGTNATLDQFLQELELRSKEPPLEPGVVPLLTIHGSKGNEFRHVYLIGLAEGILPSFQSKQSGDNSPQLEEERRNCFVAITRCRETLTLSRAETYGGWRKDPSRFLAEMQKNL
ncbi:MAG: ATP-dependent helicase [Pseudomonadota bacterium]